jgi:hypothetical protein
MVTRGDQQRVPVHAAENPAACGGEQAPVGAGEDAGQPAAGPGQFHAAAAIGQRRLLVLRAVIPMSGFTAHRRALDLLQDRLAGYGVRAAVS